MKIEIGEYVRTKEGDITRITRFCELEFNKVRINSIVGENGCLYGNPDKVVKKHSHNIIDLIEIGDYVNGYKVRGKTKERVVLDYYYYSDELCDGYWISLRDNIYSIVTKEQFKNMEYRV